MWIRPSDCTYIVLVNQNSQTIHISHITYTSTAAYSQSPSSPIDWPRQQPVSRSRTLHKPTLDILGITFAKGACLHINSLIWSTSTSTSKMFTKMIFRWLGVTCGSEKSLGLWCSGGEFTFLWLCREVSGNIPQKPYFILLRGGLWYVLIQLCM